MPVTPTDIVVLIIVVCATALFVLTIYYDHQYYQCLIENTAYNNSLKNLNLIISVYNLSVPNYSITGVAQGDHFCVYTNNRTITEVLNTCTHEYAHTNLHLKD